MSGHALPRARDLVRQAEEEELRRERARGRLLQHPWLCRRWRLAGGQGGALACEKAQEGAQYVLVRGDVLQQEAEALALVVASGGLWEGARHGHAHVVCGVAGAGVEVTLERADPAAAARLEAFGAGFLRHVVISDQHLGVPPRDTFGPAKGRLLVSLLRRVIQDRSTLVSNGDFLELLHERYGEIRRSYAGVFELLPQVRRLIYVAGNHDDDVLRENIKATRRRVRRLAQERVGGRVREQERGVLRVEGMVTGPRRAGEWLGFLSDDRVRSTILEILDRRRGGVWLTQGMAEDGGVAFQRLGTRDTDEEQPQWYLDESLLDMPDREERLLRMLADRRQRLDRVLQRDWGLGLRIQRYHWDAARSIYCEHGHFAMPECHGNRLGRAASVAAGWSKRLGFHEVEHWFEEHLGGWLRRIHPFDSIRQIQYFLEREMAVATALALWGGGRQRPVLICSHTHEVAAVRSGPVHALLEEATGAAYANTGAWSSRFRLKREGKTRVEWLEVDAANRVVPRVAVACADAEPASSEVMAVGGIAGIAVVTAGGRGQIQQLAAKHQRIERHHTRSS